jgi:hypothetical protein
METREVLRTRLAGQQLRERRAATAEEAVKNLLAVQAQEFPYARWSLAQRTAGATAADVEQAVADGRILRTHILRPTWHFVHRDDLPWLRALSAPRLHQANGGTYRRTGIDDAAASRSAGVLAASWAAPTLTASAPSASCWIWAASVSIFVFAAATGLDAATASKSARMLSACSWVRTPEAISRVLDSITRVRRP